MISLFRISYYHDDCYISFYINGIWNQIYQRKGLDIELLFKKEEWFYKKIEEKEWKRVHAPYQSISKNDYLKIVKIDEMPKFEPCYFSDDQLVIGRLKQCFLRYDDSEISRYHFKISKQDHDWVIDDLNSCNGIYVNGRKINRCLLYEGDCIQFACYTIYFFPYCLFYESHCAKKMHAEQRKQITLNTLKLCIKPIQLPVFEPDCIIIQPFKDQLTIPTHSFLQMLPTMLMSLTSIMMSAMMFLSMNKQKADKKTWIPGIIMVFLMIMTQMFVPLCIHQLEKKQRKKKILEQKKEYESYLKMKDEQLCLQASAFQTFTYTIASFWLPNEVEQIIPIWFLSTQNQRFMTFVIGECHQVYKTFCNYQSLEFDKQNECNQWYQKCINERNKRIQQVIFFDFKNTRSIGVYGKYAKTISLFILWQLCKNQDANEFIVLLFLPTSMTRKCHLRFLPHCFLTDHTRLLYTSCTPSAFKQAIKRIDEQPKQCLIVSMETIPYLPKENYYWLQIAADQDVLSSSHTTLFGCDQTSSIEVVEYQNQYQVAYQGYEESYLIHAFHQLESFSHTEKQYPPFYFLDLYQVSDVKALHVKKRWQKKRTQTLAVPIGIDEEKKLVYLDAHASKHGPHGILAGMTGAGKSEWLMTYILSLCVNFSCEKVSFVIVDYKGGMMGNAFLNIPHICNVITNFKKQRIQRFLDALESEILDREAIFEKAKNIVGTSFCDIDCYQKWYDEGIVKQAVAHLFLIVDEFAEMKMESPQALQIMIKIARIGRSLGIHVLLATQKPYGIIDDQIWSNAHFHVCLKVQERNDSLDVIKKEDAWFLKEAGEFYLQVGHDEYFVKGKSSYTQASYTPSTNYCHEQQKRFDIYQDQGDILYSKRIQQEKGITQFEAVCNELCRVQNECNYQRPFFLPEELTNKQQTSFYTENKICLGEYEDSKARSQGLWMEDLQAFRNVFVVGSAIREFEMFVEQICFECERLYTNEQCVIFIFHANLEIEKLSKLSVVAMVESYKGQENIDEFLNRIEKWKQEKIEMLFILHDPATFKLHHPMVLQYFERQLLMQQDHIHIFILTKHISNCSMTMYAQMEQFLIFHMQDEKEYMSYFHDVCVYPRFCEGNGVYMDEKKTIEVQLHPYDETMQEIFYQLQKERNPKFQLPDFPTKIQALYEKDALYVGIDYEEKKDVWIDLKQIEQVFILSLHQNSYETYIQEWNKNYKSDWNVQMENFQQAAKTIYLVHLEDAYAFQFYTWFRNGLTQGCRIWVGEGYEKAMDIMNGKFDEIIREQDILVFNQGMIQKVRRLEV